MPSVIGEAFLQVRPETGGFGSELKSKLGILGPIGAAVGGVAAIGLAVGGTLLAVGEKFQDAFNLIATKTGAVGAQLNGLDASFKQVFSTSASSMTDVANAVSQVSVRTGLSGAGLDALSKQYVDLARITKTDVTADIASASGVFAQFGIAAGQQAGQLDVLFKASQAAGVGVDTFTQSLATVAPTAQGLGLRLDQTAALTAQITKLGLPATKVMAGLGVEFSKAAKSGQDPLAVIGSLVQQIKEAPDATTAATIATAKFGIGARQAFTLVDALRSGVTNFGATLGTITSGRGGIEATATATETLGTKFAILRNRALTAIEPIAMKVVDFADSLADKIPAALHVVSQAWDDVVGGFQNPGAALGPGVSALSRIFITVGADARVAFDWLKVNIPPILTEVRHVLDDVVSGARTFIGFLGQNWHATLAAAGAVVAAIVIPALISLGTVIASAAVAAAPFVAVAAIAFGVVYAYEHFKIFRDVVHDVVSFFTGTVVPAFQSTVSFFTGTFIPDFMRGWDVFTAGLRVVGRFITGDLVPAFQTAFHVISAVIGTDIDIVTQFVSQVSDEIGAVVGIFGDLISFVSDIFQGKWSDAFGALIDIPRRVFGLIEDTVGNVIRVFTNLPSSVTGELRSLATGVVSFFASLPGRILSALGDLAGTILSAFGRALTHLASSLPGLVLDVGIFFTVRLPALLIAWTIKADVWLIGVGLRMINGLAKDLVDALPAIGSFFVSLPGRINGFVVDAGKWLIGIGVKVIQGLVGDFVTGLFFVAKFFNGLPGYLLGLLKDAGTWLIHVGEDIIKGLVKGIENGVNDLPNAVGKVAGKITDAVTGPFKHVFGMSPSPLFIELGHNMVNGLVQGIGEFAHLPAQALGGIKVQGPSLGPSLVSGPGAPALVGGAIPGLQNGSPVVVRLQQMIEMMRMQIELQRRQLQASQVPQRAPVSPATAAAGPSLLGLLR